MLLDLNAQLMRLSQTGLLRKLRPMELLPGAKVRLSDGKTYINFASNDYLGLALHPALREAAHKAIDTYGLGSGASRLVTGTHPLHEKLEQRIAQLKHTEAALTFSAGYTTSVGVISALMSSADTIIMDKLSHASLIDGAKLSGATIRVFPHNNIHKLESLLKTVREKSPQQNNILIITESIFSMDGDRAPLTKICDLKEKYEAMLLVDEAHAFGLIGEHGAGLAEELGLQSKIDLQMGTFSKAAGVSGGYIACSQDLKQWFINSSRSFIYSTSPPPVLAASILAALNIIDSNEGKKRRQHLAMLAQEMNQLLGSPDRPTSSIFPYIIGENEEAIAQSERLSKLGFIAPAIRYPTVPKGTARLRLTITAEHSIEDVKNLVHAIKQ